MRRVVSRVGLFLALFFSACGGGGGGSALSTGTGALPPITTTQPATGVTPTGAVLNASVNPNGESTQVWFEYGTDSTLAIHTTGSTQTLGNGIAGVSVNFAISGLAADTTYYFRVNASSAGGLRHGAIMSLTPGSPASGPVVLTFAATGITTGGAGLSGRLNPNGQVAQAWFEWWAEGQVATPSSTSRQAIASGNSDVAVAATLIGLTPNTIYYYRIAGSNADGTSKGAVLNFTTLSAETRTCKDCHGGDNGDPGQVVNNAPNITKYWLTSGHGKYSTRAPLAVGRVQCEDCHDTGYLSGASHKTNGAAGLADPPGNINTLMWPGKTATADTGPNLNTAHLKSAFFPVSPTQKVDYAWAFDRKCGSLSVGCHSILSHVGKTHPTPNIFARPLTKDNPKLYPWYSIIDNAADYTLRFYESPAVWTVSDLTTRADDASFSDNEICYGVCVTCHDPHGTNTTNVVGVMSSNAMLRSDFSSAGTLITCNAAACHG